MKKYYLTAISFLITGLGIAQSKDSTKTGVATYYAKYFEGRKTATGEIFKHKKLTAASNNFKLGSLVRVTNKTNGASVIVRINDRMHPKMAKMGRVVDLTRAAATLIGFTGSMGMMKVVVQLL